MTTIARAAAAAMPAVFRCARVPAGRRAMSGSARRALRILETVGKCRPPARRHRDRPAARHRRRHRLPRPRCARARRLSWRAIRRRRATCWARPSRGCGRAFSPASRSATSACPICASLPSRAARPTSLTVPVGWYALAHRGGARHQRGEQFASLGEVRAARGEQCGQGDPRLSAGGTRSALCRLGAAAQELARPRPTRSKPSLSVIRKRGFHGRGDRVRVGPRVACAAAAPRRSRHRRDRDRGAGAQSRPPGFHDDLGRWIDIVRMIEALARARPALFENPFDHVDAESIVLRHARA